MTAPDVVRPPRRRSAVPLALAVAALAVVVAGVALLVARDDRAGGTAQVGAGEAVVGATRAGAASAYVTLDNDGDGTDRLVGVTSPSAGAVSLHVTEERDGLSIMQEADGLDVPPGSGLTMAPGGTHLMLEDLAQPLEAGSTVTLRLSFERSGDVEVRAEVLPLEALAERVGR